VIVHSRPGFVLLLFLLPPSAPSLPPPLILLHSRLVHFECRSIRGNWYLLMSQHKANGMAAAAVCVCVHVICVTGAPVDMDRAVHSSRRDTAGQLQQISWVIWISLNPQRLLKRTAVGRTRRRRRRRSVSPRPSTLTSSLQRLQRHWHQKHLKVPLTTFSNIDVS